MDTKVILPRKEGACRPNRLMLRRGARHRQRSKEFLSLHVEAHGKLVLAIVFSTIPLQLIR